MINWPWKKQKEFVPIQIGGDGGEGGKLEIHSMTWRFIFGYCKDKIKDIRSRNDSVDIDPIRTAFNRGKIAAYKEIRDLPVNEQPRRTAQQQPDDLY